MPGTDLATFAQLKAEIKLEGAAAAAKHMAGFRKEADHAEVASTKLQRRIAMLSKTVGILVGVIATLKIGQLTVGAIKTAMEFEKLDVQMKAITGSAKAASEATEWVKKFTRDTPYQLQQTTQAFIKLKAFGIDPMSGAMQAVADSAAKLGADAETMNTIILALGKAWSRGKMEGEDFNMMLERGVPVTRLFSETLGLTEAQIYKLRESGLLGRDAIQALMDAMEDTSKGASAAFMETLPGRISNLWDAVAEAQDQFARAGGITDEVSRAVSILTEEITKMREAGRFEEMGAAIASALRPLVSSLPIIIDRIEDVVGKLWEWRGAAVTLVKVMAQLWLVNKIGIFVDHLNKIVLLMKALMMMRQVMAIGGITEATAQMGAMRTALAGLPPGLKLAGDAAITAGGKFLKMSILIHQAQLALIAAYAAAKAFNFLVNKTIDAAPGVNQLEIMNKASLLFQEAVKRDEALAERLKATYGDLDTAFQRFYKNYEGYKAAVQRGDGDQLDPVAQITYESVERAKELQKIFKELNEERAKGAEAAELEKEMEETMRKQHELGQKLLAQIQDTAEAEKTREQIAKGLLKVHSDLEKLQRKNLRAVYEINEAEFEGIRLQQEYQDSQEEGFQKTMEFLKKKVKEENDAHKDKMDKLKEEVGDMVKKFDQGFAEIGNSFSQLLNVGMAGDLKNFGALWDNIWQGLAKSAIGIIGEAFTNMLEGRTKDAEGEDVVNLLSMITGEQSVSDLSAGQRVAMGVGGAGMVYQGAQQGGTGGAVQGMMGGAMAGFSIGGPWGAVIGGVIGGLAGYFGGGDEAKPQTNIQYLGPGAMWAGGTRGAATIDQDMTAREDRLFSMGLGGMYRDISEQWRDLLRGFQDMELFDVLGEMPVILNEQFNMTAQEVEAWLRESQLPRMFQSAYGRAIRTGLRNLGMTSDSIHGIFQSLQDMPGTERVEALGALISALKGIQDLLDLDFAALEDRAGMSGIEIYVESMEQASEAMDLLTSGWENMSLLERASDLEAVGMTFESMTQSTLQMISTLDDLLAQMADQFDALREKFETKGMGDEELWSYYEGQYNRYATLLAGTDDPALIAEYTQRMMDYLSRASDLIPEETWEEEHPGGSGETYQEWFLRELTRLETEATEAVQAQRDRIQEQYDLLYDQLATIRINFETLGTAVESEVIPEITGLGGAAGGAREAVQHFHKSLEVASEALSTFATSSNASGAGTNGNGALESAQKSLSVTVSPPVVNVTINGSLAQLDAMIETKVVRHASAMMRAADPGKVVTGKGVLS